MNVRPCAGDRAREEPVAYDRRIDRGLRGQPEQMGAAMILEQRIPNFAPYSVSLRCVYGCNELQEQALGWLHVDSGEGP